MKKEDINFELISKIEIQLDNTLFYMPGETITGKIILNPKYRMKIKDNFFHCSLKIMQYEFWEKTNIEINELKNIHATTVQEENIEYEFRDNGNDLPPKPNDINFTIIEKENEDKNITIPFQIKLTKEKILPTFQYEEKNYILGIRHLLIAECKEYNSSNYIGLFVGKIPNKEFIEAKSIKESFIVDIGTLEIIANYPTLSFKTDGDIIVDIKTNSNLYFKKITEIQQKFYRKIEWKGFMKNSVLSKNIYDNQTFTYNENKYGLISRLTVPLKIVYSSLEGGVKLGKMGFYIGSRFGFAKIIKLALGIYSFPRNAQEAENERTLGGFVLGIMAFPLGLIGGFFKGFYDQGDLVKDIMNINDKTENIENIFEPKLENAQNQKELGENLKKFVYFKNDKVVGFVKFSKNITPPVDGYYFKCKYNIKIDVKIAGIILNRKRYLKTKIDLYDSDEYINNMKNLFKI